MSPKLTPEQIERNRAFLRDLRANEKKATKRMRDEMGGRCCLCVAYDSAIQQGAVLPPTGQHFPPQEVAEFYGWPSAISYIYLIDTEEGRRRAADDMNDGNDGPELTHAQIADAFEATFPELKEGGPQ